MAKTPYELWQEDKKRRETAPTFREASKASRIQYTNPHYQSNSDKPNTTYKWEKSALEGIKGKSNNDKFEKLTKAAGMDKYEAQEFRKYLDAQEDSQKEVKLNKDGSVSKNQTVRLGQGMKLQSDVTDSIVQQSNQRAQQQIELQAKKKKQEEKVAKKKKEEETRKNRPLKEKVIDTVLKGLEIIDRPGDAVRTGIKEKAEGDSFWQGAKDGFTGKKNTTGKEVNKALGFDVNKSDVAKSIATFLGRGFVATSPTGGLNAPVVNDNIAKKVGTETAGVVTELATDPLNLVGVGIATKAKNLLKSGKTVKQVADELKVPVEVVEREFIRGTLPGQELVDPNALRLEAPKPDPLRFLDGPTEKTTEVLGLNEPLYRRSVEGVGKDVNIEGIPQLNAPKQSLREKIEADDWLGFLQPGSAKTRPLKPLDSRQNQAYWQQRYEDFSSHVNSTYEPNTLTPDILEEAWSRFANYDEPVNLEKLVDLAYPKGFKETPKVDPVRSNIDSVLDDVAPVSRPKETVDKVLDEMPLSFKQTKQFKVNQEPVSYVGRMDPKDQSAVRSEGEFTTRYKETPTGDTLEINPAPPLEFKTQVESRPFKTQTTKNRKDIVEVVNDSIKRPGTTETPNPRTNPFGVDNETPLGAVAGQKVDPYADSPIANVKAKSRKLSKDIENLKTQIGSDTQPFYEVEKNLAKAQNVNADSLLPDGTFKAKDSLYKSLRGVRRATKAAMHSIDKTYKPMLLKLEKSGIQRKQFEEYALAKHADDILRSNEAKAKRKGDILNTELPNIQRQIQATNDKKVVAQLKKQEYKLLKELNGLEPYVLPKKATPDWVANTLKQWKGNTDMTAAQKEFVAHQQSDMQLLVKAGRFTQEEVDELFKKHPNYIDMGRHKEDYEPSLAINKKRDLGSEEDILNPIDSAYMNRIITYQSAAENMAKQKIEKLAKLNGADQYFKEIPMGTKDENALKNSISFYVDGVEKLYELPPTLKNAYENLKLNEADTVITKFISSVANVTRKGSTHFNLDFIMKSIVRESQTPLLTSRTGLHPGEMVLGFLDSFMGEGLEKMTKGKFKSYKSMYKELGGHSSGFITMDYTSVNKVTKAMKKGSLGQKWDIINPLKNIERLGAAVEHAPKLAEFRSAKNKGYDDMDAMFEAMDVFDHSDAGTAIRTPNKFVPYLNAAIRGNVRILEQMTKSPKDAAKFFGKGVMYVSAPTLAVYGMRFAPGVSDDQRARLRDMPEWKRNMFWHMPIPNTDEIVAIPKAHLVAQMFANPIERVLDATVDYSNKSGGELAKDTVKDTLKSLTPPNGIALLSQLQAVYSNYDSFSQMPIEDSTMLREPDVTKRHNVYTSGVAKGIGNLTNTSPAKIDYGIKSLTGGVGRDVLDTIDNLVSDKKKVNSTTQILNPMDSAIDDKTSGSGTYNRLYDAVQKGNKRAEGYYDAIYDLNKIVKSVRESTELSSKEKREQIEDLRRQQKEIGDQALKDGVLKKK